MLRGGTIFGRPGIGLRHDQSGGGSCAKGHGLKLMPARTTGSRGGSEVKYGARDLRPPFFGCSWNTQSGARDCKSAGRQGIPFLEVQMNIAEAKQVLLNYEITAEVRRKLSDLADSDVPITWELLEDHGLFGLFGPQGQPPTREELKLLVA